MSIGVAWLARLTQDGFRGRNVGNGRQEGAVMADFSETGFSEAGFSEAGFSEAGATETVIGSLAGRVL